MAFELLDKFWRWLIEVGCGRIFGDPKGEVLALVVVDCDWLRMMEEK